MLNEQAKEVINDLEYKDVLWCGPAAISAYTGARVSEIVDILKDIRGNYYAIKGIYFSELNECMKRLGWDAVDILPEGDPLPLEEFALVEKRPCIVYIAEHFVMLENGYLTDSQNEYSSRVENSPYRRRPVTEAYYYIYNGNRKYSHYIIANPDKESPDKCLEFAKKLFKGIPYDLTIGENGEFVVSWFDEDRAKMQYLVFYDKRKLYKFVLDIWESS